MKNVLLVHNYYRQPGGEDQVFAAEGDLLEDHGHKVVRYTVRGPEIALHSNISLAIRVFWNPATYRTIRAIIREEKIEVVHFHNTVPLVSPAAYYAAKKEGAAVVQTLHNYRFLCPEARFFRDGHICELCLGRSFALPAITNACYQKSRGKSAVLTTMLAFHNWIGTYQKMIDRFIALTHFAREKMILGGYDEKHIAVKPNFVLRDPGQGTGTGGYALFVGRVCEEKGIATLLDAWAKIKGTPPLKIAGDGPLSKYVAERIKQVPGIEFLGHLPGENIVELMKDASFLVVPSVWYEGFPMTIVEAFSTGLPVLCSNIGGMAEVVENNVTGKHFRVGDPNDLAKQVRWLVENADTCRGMRDAARAAYAKLYNPEVNYKMLLDIYEKADSRNA